MDESEREDKASELRVNTASGKPTVVAVGDGNGVRDTSLTKTNEAVDAGKAKPEEKKKES